jgi:hypothetical protein
MERIGKILKHILDPSMVSRGQRYQELFHGWSRIVGRKLGALSRICELEGQTVVVAVDHPAALTSIMMIEPRIVAALRRRFPDLDIKRVRTIVQAPGVRSRASVPRPVDSAPPSPEVSRALERVKDEELKAALQSFYSAIRDSSDDGSGESR